MLIVYRIVLELLVEGMFLLLVLVRQVHTRTGTCLAVRLTAQPNVARMVECEEGAGSHDQQVDTNVKLAAFEQQRIRNVPGSCRVTNKEVWNMTAQ